MKKENLSKITFKNSIYILATIFTSKISSLLFIIILARFLLPESFGIYSLALSIVVIAISLTDLGINSTLIKYVSEAMGKNKKGKARNYFRYLLKLKGAILILVILILLAISKQLSQEIFNKPLLFLPIVVSVLYILVESLRGFVGGLFLCIKYLKPLPLLELISQILKILLSLLVLFFLPDNLKVSGIFLVFALSSFSFLLLSLLVLRKKEKNIFFGENKEIDKSQVLKYLKFMSLASVSILFFGSVDTLMLGRFVEASYLGYYRAALGFILAISVLFSFSATLLPIFTQINKGRLERGFNKVFRYIVMFSIPSTVGVIFLAKYITLVIYGPEYSISVFPLYTLAFLIISGPLIDLYSLLFKAKERVDTLAKITIASLSINIFLNYFLIKLFLNIDPKLVLVGVGSATVVSRVFLLSFLIVKTKKHFKIKLKKSYLFLPFISSLVMLFFLVIFNYYIDINIFSGIIEIFIGMVIYFITLFLVKGVDKEDLKILKYLIKK